MQLRYQGVIHLISDFLPPRSCFAHMMGELTQALPRVSRMEFIANDSLAIAQDRLGHLRSVDVRLPLDQAMAIAAYSYDLGLNSQDNREDNLYVQLNIILRERNPDAMQLLKPYLTYLMRGLNSLPIFKGEVFRGIPRCALPIIHEHY